ncbi:THO complex subunit 7 homolog [Tetranychus urticae]|uniref:THO complex subunit 7 homolog n=1 Tax=Tetranychus urticae TaxID=32264 RepID=T1KYY5_TETUR|nr:THO complex subunit 7 homolog isoform X2 [Tetranychus urticae]XP_015791864.1 THO complex subunit 7 homolog [Tetranychus urticae]
MAVINFTEDDIIKRKLLIDGDGLGDDRRINLMLKTFFKWCSTHENDEEQALNYERILLMLTNCEHSMAKSQQILSMNHLEMKNYQELYNKIDTGIADSQRKIAELKAELQQAKIVRKNKQEYDVLAQIIMDNPDRCDTLSRLNQLEEEINKLQQIKENLNKRLEKRGKQFQVLLTSAHELKKMLSDEDNNIVNSIDDQFLDNLKRSDKPAHV